MFYVNKVGATINYIIPFLIFVIFGINGFNEKIFVTMNLWILWGILLLNNLVYLIYALTLQLKFQFQIKEYHKKGIPIDSTSGFEFTSGYVKRSFRYSFITTSLVGLSFFVYLTVYLQIFTSKNISSFLIYFSLSLLLLMISAFISLEFPDIALLEPGNFLAYHNPKLFPTLLDNLLGDSVKTYLDPRTRFQFDDWELIVNKKLNKNFEEELDEETRLERAIERILLITYLYDKMPNLFEDTKVTELYESVITPEYVDNFMEGKYSSITYPILRELIQKLKREVPEIFTLIDRLMVELMVNPLVFEKEDRLIEIVLPEQQSDIQTPFRILVFVLNLGYDKPIRRIKLNVETSRDLEPKVANLNVELDNPETKLRELLEKQKRTNGALEYSETIIDIMTYILQVGDSVWFQLIPTHYGRHVINLSIHEDQRQIYGASTTIHVTYSLKNNLKKIVGSLSGLGGVFMTIIKGLLSFSIF